MAYVILQLAVSLDGYIAKTDGTVDFLDEPIPEFNDQFQSFITSVDSIVMGRNTYNQMVTFGDIPFKDKDIYVLTHQSDTPKAPHVRFVNEPIEKVLNQISGQVWLFGGSGLIKQCMDLEQIDEFQLFIVPHLLGEGIPLFQKNVGLSDLTLRETKQYGNNVYLTYTKKL